MSSNVGGMAAHWTARARGRGGSERIAFLPDLDELLAEGERLLGVTTDAFDGVPFAELVRDRLAPRSTTAARPSTRVQRMPLAVHRRGRTGASVWSGSTSCSAR